MEFSVHVSFQPRKLIVTAWWQDAEGQLGHTSDVGLLDITRLGLNLRPAAKPVQYPGHVGSQLDACPHEPEVRGHFVDFNVGEALFRQGKGAG